MTIVNLSKMEEELNDLHKAWQRRTTEPAQHLECLAEASRNLMQAWQEYSKSLQESKKELVELEAK